MKNESSRSKSRSDWEIEEMTTEVAKVVEPKRKRSFEDSASVRTSRRLQGECATVLGASEGWSLHELVFSSHLAPFYELDDISNFWHFNLPSRSLLSTYVRTIDSHHLFPSLISNYGTIGLDLTLDRTNKCSNILILIFRKSAEANSRSK